MATENQSPTSTPVESASPQVQGGDVGGALSESDFVRYFKGKLSDNASTEAAPEVKEATAETEAASHDDVIDISELEDDSTDTDAAEHDGDSTDTKASEPEQVDAEPVFEIQVDGKTIEVKQSELVADAQKYRASQSKFEEASKMRKEADEVKAFYTKDRDTLSNLLAQYQNFMTEQMNARQPDWQSLLANDPLEYIRQKEYHSALQQEMAQAKAYQEQIRKQQELERKTQAEKYSKQQLDKVFEMFPHWKNPEVRNRDTTMVKNFLTNAGFTAQEQDGLTDARMLDVVMKAAKYDQAVKAKDQKKAKPATGKTLTAGVAQTSDPDFKRRQAQTANAREAKAKQDRFKQDGSREAFMDMFKSKLSKPR
ncbi:hypothetical protein [Caballeronia zhejiangensis]|uniref:hypothetical protein n=1 Tax=Caballeronia zhejiangensis TaxID=871203 RepID=UPI001F5203D6|nr:hypothetical protein [Caballeronia zhejiangensis]MCI1046927.1 hypothetical protein [Caballeronia zhejiangensis]